MMLDDDELEVGFTLLEDELEWMMLDDEELLVGLTELELLDEIELELLEEIELELEVWMALDEEVVTTTDEVAVVVAEELPTLLLAAKGMAKLEPANAAMIILYEKCMLLVAEDQCSTKVVNKKNVLSSDRL